MVFQLHRFISALEKYHSDSYEIMKETDIFPIEIDLDLSAFHQQKDEDVVEVEDDNDQAKNNAKQPALLDDLDAFYNEN